MPTIIEVAVRIDDEPRALWRRVRADEFRNGAPIDVLDGETWIPCVLVQEEFTEFCVSRREPGSPR